MDVRSATAADIDDLTRLERFSATAAHWSREHYEQVFREAAPQRLALVIEEQGCLQGFIAARQVVDEWEIENIAIAGPARRRGLGTRLLEEFLDRIRTNGAAVVFLEVRESNCAARALYEKWAFEEHGRRVRYYTQPDEDAIVYRLSLV